MATIIYCIKELIMNKFQFFFGRLGAFLMGLFFLAVCFLMLAVGATFYQWNPEHTLKHHYEVSPSQQFIAEFQRSHARLPELEEFEAWNTSFYLKYSGERDYNYYHKTDFPDDLVRLAGKPPQNAYYLDSSDVDAGSIYLASWYENGTVGLITDKEYYWGGSRTAHCIITFSIFMFFCIIAMFFFSLTFEKNSKCSSWVE